MLSQDERIQVADRIFYELMPEGGHSWETGEMIGEVADPMASEPADLRAVIYILARDFGVRANLVNSLWFRNGDGQVTTPEDAQRYLPRTASGRPARGIRLQGDSDDPFALATETASVRRAAVALPRAAARIARHAESGRYSSGAVATLTAAAHDRATEEVTPELAGVVRQMLPNGSAA